MSSTLLNNLKAYYKLDESSGNAIDSSGGGFTLTNNNTVTYTTGKINNGASGGSSNTNKYLSISNDLGITGTSCSISFWVKNNTEISSNRYAFVQQADLGTFVNNFVWYEYNGGTRRLQFCRQTQNVGGTFVSYNLTMGTSSWYHVVYTYDGTDVRGYVNGSLVAGPTGASGSGSAGTIDAFQILSYYAYGSQQEPASSIVDEVGVWDRAITGAEVTELYRSGTGIQYPFITYSLLISVGAFVYTGLSANLLFKRLISIAKGTFIYTGFATALNRGRGILIEAGAYILNGISIALRYTGWTNQAKNNSTYTNQSRDNSTWTNQSKN